MYKEGHSDIEVTNLSETYQNNMQSSVVRILKKIKNKKGDWKTGEKTEEFTNIM